MKGCESRVPRAVTGVSAATGVSGSVRGRAFCAGPLTPDGVPAGRPITVGRTRAASCYGPRGRLCLLPRHPLLAGIRPRRCTAGLLRYTLCACSRRSSAGRTATNECFASNGCGMFVSVYELKFHASQFALLFFVFVNAFTLIL